MCVTCKAKCKKAMQLLSSYLGILADGTANLHIANLRIGNIATLSPSYIYMAPTELVEVMGFQLSYFKS